MKTILIFLLGAFSFANADDFSDHCADSTGMYEYSPITKKLIYNSSEIYKKSDYRISFGEVQSVKRGSCVATNGETYKYERTKYTLNVQYRAGVSGAETLNCERWWDELPAGLNCKEN